MKPSKINYSKPKEKSSIFFLSCIIVLIAFYVFAFNSKDFIGDSNYTYDHEEKILAGNDIRVEEWLYDSREKEMHIVLSSSNALALTEYNLKGLFRNNSALTESVAQILDYDSTMAIVALSDVPRFQEVALSIRSDSGDEARFYDNINSVVRSSELSSKSLIIYRIDMLNRQIEENNTIIQEKEQTISSYESEIQNLQNRILELEANKKYQTHQQIEETNSQISSMQSNIESDKRSIQSLREEIKEYQNRIENLQKQIEDLQRNER